MRNVWFVESRMTGDGLGGNIEIVLTPTNDFFGVLGFISGRYRGKDNDKTVHFYPVICMLLGLPTTLQRPSLGKLID